VTVKGSKQYKLVVVRYQPMQRAVLMVVAALFVVAGLFFAHYVGFTKSEKFYSQVTSERDELRELVLKQDKQLSSINQHLANATVSADVDKQAVEELRKEIVALNEQISELEASNTFYRQLMEPKAGQSGLTIGALNILPSSGARKYTFDLMFKQLTTNHKLINGTTNITISGVSQGLPASYSLHDLSEEYHSGSIKLRFKYFQTIRTEVVLPEGFEPRRVDVKAATSGNKPVTVEKGFGWVTES
jgi:hypothetical protein